MSVIVLGWRNAERLHACLAALAHQRADGPSFETIIVLNGALDAVVSMVDESVTGAYVVRSPVNLGFAGGCNRAAKAARGEFLALLNDDAEVAGDWLDALVRAADDTPEAGAVGSRITNPDGLLLEAGSLLWRDGAIANVGRDLPSTTSRYNYRRRVDYCSASALLIRRTTWDQIGGFDESFFPGYYEDVDFCLALARLGQKVVYEPRAQVVHRESSSLGWGSAYKEFVAGRNRERFVLKWAADLSRRPVEVRSPGGVERAARRAQGLSLRALFVDERLAAPGASPRVGRVVEASRQLARRGYAVSVFPTPEARLRRRLGDAGIDTVEPADLPGHLSAPETMYDAVVIAGTSTFEAVAPLVRLRQPEAGLVYDAETPGAVPPVDAGGTPPDHVVCGEAWSEALDAARLARRAHNRRQHARTFTS